MLEIGSIIDGKYKILNKIGQGGMSVVYLAMNERANKQWAVKEVRKDGVKDYDVVRQGLIAETDILKRLNHPNLPSIIDVIDRDDTFLIVMDYIEGKNLDYWLKTEGAQPQEKVVEWAIQICDVLGYLHSRRPPIIYRDLKPANIMLRPDGQIEIIDFGTAREFKESSVEDTSCLGTQGYAAPEQYGGHGQTDARTDIYTLGATMYHLLTGHNPSLPPYEMYPIRYWDPSLSSGLEQIILKCTQRDPDKRYQNCAELMYALEHYTELDYSYRKKQKRKMHAFLATSAAAIVSLVLCAGFNALRIQTRNTNYDALLQSAQEVNLSEDFDPDTFDYYKSAIAIKPQEADAYTQMLSYCFNNNNYEYRITSTEYGYIQALMGEYGDTLRLSDEDAYVEFCYQLGKNLVYYYDTQFNYDVCKSWLNVVISADEDVDISEIKRETAQVLYSIAKFTSGQTAEDTSSDTDSTDLYGSDLAQANDTAYSTYADYWDGLVQITDNISVFTEAGDNVTVITVYQYLSQMVYENANQFKNAGVERADLEEKLAEAQEMFGSLSEQGVTGYSSSKWEELQALVTSALGRVETAYAGSTSNRLATEGGTTE